MDGQRLVPVNGVNGQDGTEYRTEKETFVRVFSRGVSGPGGGNGPAYWEVDLPSGVRRYYGDGWPNQTAFYPATQQASVAGTSMAISNIPPVGYTYAFGGGTLSWALARNEDRVGNYYDVLYMTTGSGLPGTIQGPDGAWGTPLEQYPRMIVYTGFDTVSPPTSLGVSGASGALQPMRSVLFNYEPRSDVIDGYTAGIRHAVSQRLLSIRTYGPSPSGLSPIQSQPTSPQTTYGLTYENDSVSGRSLLKEIQQCDGVGVCLPATSFGWMLGEASFQVPQVIGLLPGEPGGLTDPLLYPGAHYRVLDANGDGKADIVAMDPNGPLAQAQPVWTEPTNLCQAAGQASGPTNCQISRWISESPCPSTEGTSRAQWQLVYYQGDGAGHFTNPAASPPIPYQSAPNVDRPVDIDHDGRDDLVLDNQFQTNVRCDCANGVVAGCAQRNHPPGGGSEWQMQGLNPASGT
jgi:hypothetical protein